MSPSPDAARDLLRDAFGRIAEGVPAVVDGLSDDELLWRPDGRSNHVAWLLWHLTRQHDAQVADLAGAEQVWRSGGWAERFALPYEPDAHGYGQSDADVAAFTVSDPSLFGAYAAAVHDETVTYLGTLDDDAAFERVVDDAWDPPVTVAVRLVSVVDDAAKHLGQAQYLKGLVERRR